MSSRPIYLDYNATTPIDPAVVDAMLPYLADHFGNPSSTHAYGKAAHDAVEAARGQVAGLLGAQPDEIVFTGGGTEASNHAIKGAVLRRLAASSAAGDATRTSSSAPSSIPRRSSRASSCGGSAAQVTRRAGGSPRLVDPERCGGRSARGRQLVSVMHSNNEVGTLKPIREIAAIARERGVLMHTDAAQSLGKVPVDVERAGRRSADRRRAQAVCPERGRGAVRPPRREAGAADPRGRARGRPAGRDGERAVHRRRWGRLRDRRGIAARGDRAAAGAARPAAGPAAGGLGERVVSTAIRSGGCRTR